MALPLFLGIAASVLGATGIGAAASGAKKMINAHSKQKKLFERKNHSEQKLEQQNIKTATMLDELGKKELKIMESFKVYSEVIEQIHNRPIFRKFEKNGVTLPVYNKEDLQKVWVGASTLLTGVSGAAIGSFGGFAAAGATSAAIMALGTSSTGVAISSLNGAAAINATLALLGGGTLASGGGGMALGALVLSGATAGVGIFIGGIIFHLSGKKISDEVNKAEQEVISIEQTVDTICSHLKILYDLSANYLDALKNVDTMYQCYLEKVANTIYKKDKKDWNMYNYEEKKEVEIVTRLAGLLFKMCQVPLTIIDNTEEINKANIIEVNNLIHISNDFLLEIM